MNQRTAEKLIEMKSFPWFANVGQAIGGDYTMVCSWKEAVELSAADIWSSVQLQIKNRTAAEVNQKNYDRFKEWNVIAAELRREIAVIMTDVVKLLEDRYALKKDFRGSVYWDLLLICLETEFSDVLPPLFFVPRLQPIYAAGHFPCGWEGPKLNEDWQGELPNPRLIVY